MKPAINITRILVGLLFVASGLIKANDPLGLAYKMDEYFTVWSWHWASPFTLYLSVGMNVLEIVAGVALLLGFAPRFITRLLMGLIIFFTFLTGYAVFSGKIKTCGCFGDCVPLEAWQSFGKDLVLMGLIAMLVRFHTLIKPILPLRANLFLVLLSAGFVFWGQLHVLQNLPYVDCLPYAKGKNLVKQMQPPPGAIPDSIAIMYIYRKAGQEVQFDANSFPTDFDEKTYEYIDRREVVVRKGKGEPAIRDFALFNSTGEDTTKAVLETTGKYLFFFARDFDGADPAWREMFVKLYLKSREKKMPVLVMTNQPARAAQWFNEQNHYNITVLTCDGTVMKTFLRTKTGLVAMHGADIAGKWSEANMNEAVRWINQSNY
jgi:uncharacterized membrane protein YphA (DoxX/SURF4 family)